MHHQPQVWDDASAIGDFYPERVREVAHAEGQPDVKPVRHGNPVAAYFRGPSGI